MFKTNKANAKVIILVVKINKLLCFIAYIRLLFSHKLYFQKKNLFATLFKFFLQAIVITAMQHRIFLLNIFYYKYFGYSFCKSAALAAAIASVLKKKCIILG